MKAARTVHVVFRYALACLAAGAGGLARQARNNWALLLVLAAHAGLLAWSAALHSPTYDEPSHLTAGLHRWHTGRFVLDRGNPPAWSMWCALPVMAAGYEADYLQGTNSFGAGDGFLEANGPRGLWLITLARWAMIPFSLLGALVCRAWARDLFGSRAGWLALGSWCVCPNVLAHGQLVTGDMPATAVGLLACYAFWHWLRSPGWAQALLAGLLLGAAQLTKYVWLPLFAIWPAVWLYWRALEPGAGWRGWLRQFAQLIVIDVAAIYALHTGYFFDEPFPTLRDSQLLQVFSGGPQPPGKEIGWLKEKASDWPVPLPKAYVQGLAEVAQLSRGLGRVFLNGVWHDRGVWHYYLAALGMKIPLGFFALLAAATLVSPWRGFRQRPLADFLPLLSVPIALLAFVCHNTSFNHVRYALPAIPFFFVWTGQLVAGPRSRGWTVFAVVAWLWAAGGSLACWPHSMSYFNETVGGPEHGYEHLIDSNVDWGQDLPFLKAWLDEHPEARPLHLAYFGVVNPKLLGIDVRAPDLTQLGRDGTLPAGWYAVSVSSLQGYFPGITDSEGRRLGAPPEFFSVLKKMQPVGRAGYSILIFQVDAAQSPPPDH